MYGSPAVGEFRDLKTSDYPVSVQFIIPAHSGRFRPDLSPTTSPECCCSNRTCHDRDIVHMQGNVLPSVRLMS
jgi:hypothetical protein